MKMTDAEISRALKERCYLDEGHGGFAGYKDLIPLLKVLLYKALHSNMVFRTAQEPSDAREVRISPMYWLR